MNTLVIILISLLVTLSISGYFLSFKSYTKKRDLLKSFRESLELNQIVSFNITNDYGTKVVKTGFIDEIEQGYCEVISKNHECAVVKYVVLIKHIYPVKWFEKKWD